jgi:glyoxylase-like metal-dependent hydrolase (beta-lactamase superfamily II)
MTEFVRIDRRLFLARLGKGTVALAILGACGPNSRPSSAPSTTVTSSTASSSAATTTTAAVTAPVSDLAEYLRVDLGFVSAYVVVRGSEAAVVDTGVSGSDGEIAAALGTAGLGWDAVGHLILTHHHPDHIGSVPAVMTAAAGATGYIGEADLNNVSAPRELIGLSDGDEVFGMLVIGTPGHTAGHISMLDPVASVLVAGDAINGGNGGVLGPNPQFSQDHDQALATVGKMAGYEYDTVYFGHGEPVLRGASQLVGTLAESL